MPIVSSQADSRTRFQFLQLTVSQGRYMWRHNRVLQNFLQQHVTQKICLSNQGKGTSIHIRGWNQILVWKSRWHGCSEEKLNGGGVGGTVASESARISAWTLLSRVRAPPPAS
ncbi:hypothetical protein PoB_001510300 [Plakobranchus ocellatus]|uniref:Uncharacterized protein n=1 Tax=Plakobranchus ocellatus TaxID=259542 RepID=A0AAV3Z264_9GAST|nr:hypothetical protein PoB_001510300 [Plakobranchus ocellatus]